MKKITTLSIVGLIMFLASACSGAAPSATEAPATTQAPSTSGNGTQVIITLENNTIESSLTTFQAGVPYTFVITNAGRHAHNFNISTPVSTAGSLDNALDNALLNVNQNRLSAGARVTVEYTFAEAAADAPLEFSCLIRRHYEDGMFLPITVTK